MFHITIVSSPNYIHANVFTELERLLIASFKSLDIECTSKANTLRKDRCNIILGYNLISDPDQLKDYNIIIYQLEQLAELSKWWTPQTIKALKVATVIWDYSEANIAFLNDKDFHNVKLIKPTYHKDLETIPIATHQNIDILFYGSQNVRRIKILDTLQYKYGLKVVRLFGVYGRQRDEYISRSKIILNIHFFESKITEQVRLSYLLNNKAFVISEIGIDNPYEDALISVPYNQIVTSCLHYLNHPNARKEQAEQGYEWMKKRPMIESLNKILN